ncbi:signal recognition particle-docking protein FtsY [Candidatus Micrarchaeota archaeon]|nr:signal recognition particle-docking protein FtsY [Candidatus Micrarchaeota archaeon]
MFDLLKKRISGFVEKLSGKGGKEEEKPEVAPPIEEEKTVSTKEIEDAAPKQPPKIEEAPSSPLEVAEEEEPLEEKAGIPKAAKPKKAEAEKKEGPAISKTVKKDEGAKKPAQKKGAKEAPKQEEPKEKTAEAGAPKEAPKKEEVREKPLQESVKKKSEPKEEEEAVPAKEEIAVAQEAKEGEREEPSLEQEPREGPKAREVREERKEPEKKKGFLEQVFGGGKKKEETKPEPKKEGIAAPREIWEIAKKEEPAEKTPEVPPIKETGPEEKEESAPAAPKGGASKEKAQKKEEELKKKVKKSLLASVSETIRGESEVKEEEIAELLDELELGMLESDVALSVAEEIKEELRKRIVGSKVKRGQTAIFVRDSLKDILLGMFKETPGFEISERLKAGEGPHKIMVVGPNGAGKTTTIAKIVNLLKKEGHSVCVAASDTFRAAAVEQLVHHGGKLGVKVIHGAYGSDPTSIAFDALNHAKSNGISIVIIDTAGRQDTNVNLINQLKKMDRVIKPELKIYVGESIAGNAMVEQISTFNNDIGLDGVVLTKLDCDPKGGTVISVSRVARLPILYVGTGQGYGDLRKFRAEEIVEEILS